METGEVYTAVIKQDGPWWIGWIEEIAGVNSQAETREKLVENLLISEYCGFDVLT